RGWARGRRRGGHARAAHHPDGDQRAALRDFACDQAGGGERDRRAPGERARRARLRGAQDVRATKGRRGGDARRRRGPGGSAHQGDRAGATRVSGILVIAEHLRGQVRPVTLELVSVAKELGDETAVAVIANDPASLADQVDVDGVAEIVSVKVDQDEFENDVYREAVEQLI